MLSFIYIFLIRIIESILNTYRTILIVNKNKNMALIIAFIEIIIWLIAVKTVITRNFDIPSTIAYALGFSLGNYVGVTINNLLNKKKIYLKITNIKNIKNLKEIIKKYDHEIYKTQERKYTLIINIYEKEKDYVKRLLSKLEENLNIDIIEYKRVKK